MNKKYILIASIIGAILVIATVGLLLSQQPSTKDDILIDRDTGEQYDLSPDEPSTGGGNELYGKIKVFGVKGFNDYAYSAVRQDAFFQDVLFGVTRFGDKRLGGTFTSITIQPRSLTTSGREIHGTLRVGQTDETVSLRVKVASSGKRAIVTVNENGQKYGGTYVYMGGIETIESYLFTITQPDDTKPDLHISTPYSGYIEAAITKLATLGYDIPDLKIVLNDYENEL